MHTTSSTYQNATDIRTTERTYAALLHLTVLTKYFIPFGNFLFPIILWVIRKKESSFVDHHGRQSLNFQISLFLYSLFIALAGIVTLLLRLFGNINDSFGQLPDVYWKTEIASNVGVIFTIVCGLTLLIGLKILELVCVISASIRAGDGRPYHFPLTIPFIKQDMESEQPTYKENTTSNDQTDA